jgi:hypothetical protein
MVTGLVRGGLSVPLRARVTTRRVTPRSRVTTRARVVTRGDVGACHGFPLGLELVTEFGESLGVGGDVDPAEDLALLGLQAGHFGFGDSG